MKQPGWGNEHVDTREPTRAAIQGIFGVLVVASLACTADDGSFTDERAVAVETQEPPIATKPTGSQDCNLSGNEVLRLTLQEKGEFSRFLRRTDAIPLHVEKDVEGGGTLTLEAVMISVDSPDERHALTFAVAGKDAELNIELPISAIDLPTHSLPVSRQLMIHAKWASDGKNYEAARVVRLYFHPQAGGWQFYDEAVRERDYSGGALTQGEREKRAAALESLPPGITAEYVSMRASKLSDDPEHIPPEDPNE